MTVMVRPVNLDSEQEELLDILERNLHALPHARRFNWLYRDNPAGTARSWFAYEKETKKIVGAASVFPRAMWVGGKIKLCGQVGDFAVDVTHRSLGPALMLQRATFEPVNRGVLGFCYDCPPHDRGMSPFRRLGIEANCQMHRYAELLKTDRLVTKRLGRGRLAVSVSVLSNLLLDLWSFRKHKPSALEISLHAGRFGEEFSLLDKKVGASGFIQGRRQAEDLNWRYREDPLHEYRVLTARWGGELIAFIIFSVSGQDAYVMDLCGLMFPDAGLQLLDAVVDHLKKEPVQTLQALVVGGSGLSGVFQKAGFSYRSKAARVVAYARLGTELRTVLDKRPNWSLNYADVLA